MKTLLTVLLAMAITNTVFAADQQFDITGINSLISLLHPVLK
jgi:hypothetical protein